MKKIWIWLFLASIVIAPTTMSATTASATTASTTTASATAQRSIPEVIPTSTEEPDGCLEPPDDYTKTKINGYTVNRRTYAMLKRAALFYGGEIDLLGSAITQGSYNDSVSASFGTHAGGGAVDISILAPNSARYRLLLDDVEPLIHALRLAGFAAWFRDMDDLYPGSPLHIHAIAIGDRELSRAAVEQLNGEAGYFRSFDGLPVKKGTPSPDRHGGPVICRWMIPYMPDK